MLTKERICEELVKDREFPDTVTCLAYPNLREKVSEYIHKHAEPELRGEIEYFKEIEREPDEVYNTVDAFEEILGRIDEDPSFHPRRLVRNAYETAVRLGVYKEITDEELARHVIMGRYRGYDFVLHGKKHVWVGHLSDVLKEMR
jgi:hypothetical protein